MYYVYVYIHGFVYIIHVHTKKARGDAVKEKLKDDNYAIQCIEEFAKNNVARNKAWNIDLQCVYMLCSL